MENYLIKPIGIIEQEGDSARIVLKPEFAPALTGIEGFRHLNLIWWFSKCDDEASRSSLQEESPYRSSPEILGTFATRSPMRPNPIALSCVEVLWVDEDSATIGIAYTDAEHGSPVLDLKPYTPSLDRVDHPETPDWCAHWPKCVEESGEFDWANEFRF